MSVLITGAGTPLGRAATDALATSGHSLRLTHRSSIRNPGHPFEQSRLGHGRASDRLVEGIDVVVHIPDAGRNPSSTDHVDSSTRCTYNLLTAASEAGVRCVLYISTLDLFLPYEEDMSVRETWRPLPSTEPGIMAAYLGEFIAEEFAQEQRFSYTCLRLGHLVTADEAAGQPYDPMWLELTDAARAIAAAVDNRDGQRFEIFHVQSSSPRSRFNIDKARSALGFEPQWDFA